MGTESSSRRDVMPTKGEHRSQPSFHRFMDLPSELRLQIWRMAAEREGSTGPMVLPLLYAYEPDWEPPRSYIHIPRRWQQQYLQSRLQARLALLHSCHEARAELLGPPLSASQRGGNSSSPTVFSSAQSPSLPDLPSPSRPSYQLMLAPQLGISEPESEAQLWREALANPNSTLTTRMPGLVAYYDDSCLVDDLSTYLFPSMDWERRCFAIDWRRDVLILNFVGGAAVWRWHAEGLPLVLGQAAQVIVVHDHLHGSPPWMHRVVIHFGVRLRGLWFLNRLVWKQAEYDLLRIPWDNNHRRGGVDNNNCDGDEEDGVETTVMHAIDLWDILIRVDMEVSRDLVARGEVNIEDLPVPLGLTTEAINGWSTPVRVGTITKTT
ncbi:hypothetical protein PG999_003300 [Apiospora kogelbergensis]|uniref:2EXR domain-containing protein n=1 Tax=Apiospora kogelbergensis TaxID=1337665 RepID=A0AAW0R360_9PEZI